jgi:hypothetical protein
MVKISFTKNRNFFIKGKENIFKSQSFLLFLMTHQGEKGGQLGYLCINASMSNALQKSAFIVNLKASVLLGNTTKVRPNS